MIDIEKLGAFYLGRVLAPVEMAGGGGTPPTASAPPAPVAPPAPTAADPAFQPLLLDSRELVTHAVCVGMTGSGKTGLCLSLLEEAAIDGIPAIAIDPKGDLADLLLTFPSLQPGEFRPWIDEEEARRAGISVDEFAARTARTWSEGLARWGQDGARIARLRAAADIAVYTPGAHHGLPLSVLGCLEAPPAGLDADAIRERVASAASGLLALLAIDADPLRSREHALLSALFGHAWEAGRSLDLASLVREIAKPPLARVGVLDIETFYPAKERMDLSLRLNNLLAAPGFAAWMEGEPLSARNLLYTADGRPRLSVISISHLDDPSRMFLVTMLLSEILSWMRTQPGTGSLRALLFMDEIFGYFPPVANPPSKTLMLTLLKQARAFGLGVVLATQNPVDLDYKGLSNAGTWFLGRLQTDRDRQRVLDGLEGSGQSGFDRGDVDRLLAGLAPRRFLLHSVHEAPLVFETRWTLSYLRGPLTRPQLAALTAERASAAGDGTPPGGSVVVGGPVLAGGVTFAGGPTGPGGRAAPVPSAAPLVSADDDVTTGSAGPVLPPEASELFVPPTPGTGAGGATPGGAVYRPYLVGSANVHYVAAKLGLDEWRRTVTAVSLAGTPPPNPWEAEPADADTLARIVTALATGSATDSGRTGATDSSIDSTAVPRTGEPIPGARFAPVPPLATRPKTWAVWSKALVTRLYQAEPLRLWSCAGLKETSRPAESDADFRLRITQLGRESRDAAVDALRKKYAVKLQAMQDRLRHAQERMEREQSQLQQQQFQTAVSAGATLLGALLGGRRGIGGVATTARAAGRAQREKGDIGRASDELGALQQQSDSLQAQVEEEIHALQAGADPAALSIEEVTVPPRKADTVVERVLLAWVPLVV
jgi:hypothetical protein